VKILKRYLPEGVRKIFVVKVGKKVKIVNKLYDKKAIKKAAIKAAEKAALKTTHKSK